MKIRKLKIDDSNKAVERNEAHVIRELQKNKREGFVYKTDSFKLAKKGAEQLHFAIREEGIDALFSKEVESEFLKRRFGLNEFNRVSDLMDSMPVYAELHISVVINWHQYEIVLVKESNETPDSLAEFRLPRIKMVFHD